MYKNKSKLYFYAIISLLALTNISGLLYSNDVNASGNPKQIERKKQKKWTQEEDNQLRTAVAQYKPDEEISWVSVAKEVSGRDRRQCRARWKNALDPNLKKGPWTPEEDEKILEKYNKLGPKWLIIEKFFSDRNIIQLRNRYQIISGKNKIARKKYNNKDAVKKQQKEYYQKKKAERLAQQNPANIDNAPAANPDVIQEEEQANILLLPSITNTIGEMGFGMINLNPILNQNE